MNEYLNSIRPFIVDIISKTNSGSIHWKRINPTTLQWIKEISSGKVRTTIQRVEGPDREYYRFEVKEIENGEELISIDTKESNEIEQEIRELYFTAEHYSFQNHSKKLAILQELLE